MLEQLARDVTGWGARAVEYFDRLATTRAMNHRRRSDVAFADIRSADAAALDRDAVRARAHLADVRHIDNGRGRYNIPHVGLHLWRLQSYPLERPAPPPEPVDAATAAPSEGRYTFSPLGYDLPLFNVPRAEEELHPPRRRAERRRAAAAPPAARRAPGTAAGPGRPPHRLQRGLLRRQPAGAARGRSRRRGDRDEVTPEEIAICDLSDADDPPATGWRRRMPRKGFKVGVDPVLGRLALPAGATCATRSRSATRTGSRATSAAARTTARASVAPLLADLPDPARRALAERRARRGGRRPDLYPTLADGRRRVEPAHRARRSA